MWKRSKISTKWSRTIFSLLVLAGLLGVQLASAGEPTATPPGQSAARAVTSRFVPFDFLWSPHFQPYERVAVFLVLAVAIAGLVYAAFLVRIVKRADRGTEKMQEVAHAIRQGSKAYLARQRRTLIPIIIILTLILIVTAPWHTAAGANLAIGRGIAFLMGSLASLTVGTIGMLMATQGNLCTAAIAPKGFGKALQFGYRTGTVTGMLIDGLGLLGATLIFMYFGDRAPAALLGFAFGGTLLALFMRVGGGIYTKAADVGADLVGKIEKDIPEDDPRNAATIADNVGDNVGDCAGMAADVFESYEVTLVAAMILGWASFGPKGVLFPLLVQAGGVFSDIISTLSVRAGNKGGTKQAMRSLNFGFRLGAMISTVCFLTIGFFYLRYSGGYLAGNPTLTGIEHHAPFWATLGVRGLDIRPAEAAFCGIILALVLTFWTEHFTGSEHSPVQTLVRACNTGHATNIIQGLALGMESSVWAIITIAGCILASVLIFSGTNPVFVAYGVAMCGLGMLTLTGNIISMDVFGPIADNANGIAEMGYDRRQMGEESYHNARQVLADLDATGNTTKAITKGIAIGSAVIAAVSLFASFIITIGSGGGSERVMLSQRIYDGVAGFLNVGNPRLLIGLLIGGAVPFLFSSMLIRAVGRAAFMIVQECRAQFRDKAVWSGTKKPDYSRVVNICTLEAQRELIGPGLLAVLTPVLVGFLLGAMALAGFLAGAILSGQLMAVFMANAGGAWDNAKKVIEDEPRDPARNMGKGSERHKASVTGDTVGDPLKDTAGPAINPLLKVMNMVSLLVIPLVLPFDHSFIHAIAARVPGYVSVPLSPYTWIPWIISLVCLLALGWAVYRSKHETAQMKAFEQDLTAGGGAPVEKTPAADARIAAPD
jgi:K(+)-stimulated pyrophosphate-energized sodium pump